MSERAIIAAREGSDGQVLDETHLTADDSTDLCEDKGFSGDPGEPPCRRPGRFRRYVLRPLFWGFALLAVLIFVLQLLLNAPRTRDWAKNRIATEVGQILDREIRIRDIEFTVIPLSVQVWNFEIAGPEPDDANFLEVPWAEVEMDANSLKRKVIRLRHIRAERPTLHLQYLDSHHNLITFPRSKRQRRFDVLIDRIEVDQAEFFLDQDSVEISLAADSVRARMHGEDHLEVVGEVAAQNVDVRLPNARPQGVSVMIAGRTQPGKITIEDAKISMPGLAAEAHGECGWPRENPKDKKCLVQVQGTGEGSVLEKLGYFSDLSGQLEYEGSFLWRPGTFGWRSTVEATELILWDRQISDVKATLSADRYGVSSFVESAQYAGGDLSGTIGYEHTESGRPIDVRLEFEDLDLDTVLDDQSIPAQGFSSRLNGRVHYRFPRAESSRGDGGGEFQVLAGGSRTGRPLVPPQVRMDGAFPIRIQEGVIRSESIRLQSERQSVLANGWYDLARLRGEFAYEVATTDVAELGDLLPFLDPDSESVALWMPYTGEGTLAGSLYLQPGEASTDLRLRLENVETATLAVPRLSGGLYADSRKVESLHLELGNEERALLVRGRIPLEEGTEDGIEMTFDALAWPLDEIRAWVPFDLPLDGPISGRLDLFIGPESSRGRLRARAEPVELRLPTAWSLPLVPTLAFESLSTDLDWDAEEIQISQMTLDGPAGRINSQGRIDFASERYDLNLRSSWLKLEEPPFAAFLPRSDLAGAMVLTGHLGGEFGQPDVRLAVQAPELRLGPRRLGRGASRLDLQWTDGQLQVQGQMLEWIDVEGGGQLDRTTTDVHLAVTGRSLGELSEFLVEQPPDDFDGHFSGSLTLRGRSTPESGTESPTLDLRVADLEIVFREHSMQNQGPVEFRLGGEEIAVQRFLVTEPASNSRLSLNGTLGYETDAPVDLEIEASIATAWLQLLFPDLETEGAFDLAARVGGTVADPFLTGRGHLQSSHLMMPTIFPHSLDEAQGVLNFHPDMVTIERLEAKMAGGTLVAAGQFAPPWRVEAADYRLQLNGKDLRLRYPEGWSLEGDTELVLRSTEDGQLLSGRADLDRIQYFEDVPVGMTQLMQEFFQRQRLEVEGSDEVLSQTLLDVELSAPGALKVRNNLVDITGSVDLLLRGNLSAPVLYGEVGIDNGGLLVYNTNDYTIDRGRLIFSSPYELAPEVDIVADTKVREVEITLALTGTLERLDARFASDPPLPDLEVFRLLSTGGNVDSDIDAVRRFDRIDQDQSTSAASFLYGQAASVIGQRVNTLFGFDKFRIEPLTGSGDNLSDARVTVGKRLTRDIFVSYSYDPTTTEEPRLRIEWQLSDDLTLVLTQNGDNSYSADARWESSF